MSIACSECKGRNIDFQTSTYDERGESVTSKILQVASICSGVAYVHLHALQKNAASCSWNADCE